MRYSFAIPRGVAVAALASIIACAGGNSVTGPATGDSTHRRPWRRAQRHHHDADHHAFRIERGPYPRYCRPFPAIGWRVRARQRQGKMGFAEQQPEARTGG